MCFGYFYLLTFCVKYRYLSNILIQKVRSTADLVLNLNHKLVRTVAFSVGNFPKVLGSFQNSEIPKIFLDS